MLTTPEWIILLLLLLGGTGFAISRVHTFLAVHDPDEAADFLIVEGWLPDEALGEVIEEFEKKPYQRLITTGIPLFQGFYLAEYKTYAELTCATLEVLGVDKDRIVPVPAPDATRNRTQTSAIAVKEWLEQEAPEVTSVNLYSLGTHTRRSGYIYKRTLGDQVKVGTLAATPVYYEANQWWKSSEGVKTVVFEVIAYVYARFFNWQS